MEINISFTINEKGEPEIFFGENQKIKAVRNGKGKSLILFPEKYVVVDIETTGLSPRYDEIIEISAIRYDSGKKVDVFSTLVKPDNEIDDYITELTGITNEMVEGAPTIDDCINDFIDFMGEDIVIGYNVNFDINFLYDNLLECKNEVVKNDFVDVMRIARKALPELKHHRQKDIASYFGIPLLGAHRAEVDCEVCNECFVALKDEIIKSGVELEAFIQQFKHKSRFHKGVSAKDIKSENMNFDESHPLYGKVCVFTGALEKMHRKEAMQLVANLGGIPGDGVTKKTNFLILGNNDYCKTIVDGKSSKQKKAEKLILEGQDLQILPEEVFYDIAIEE